MSSIIFTTHSKYDMYFTMVNHTVTVIYHVLQYEYRIMLFYMFFLVVLRNRQLFHTTYKIYMSSISLEVVYLFIACISYGKYANDGLDNYKTKVLGKHIFLSSIELNTTGATLKRNVYKKIDLGNSFNAFLCLTTA